MQNCVDEKSILAVLEQIHMKVPIEQRKLWETVGNEIKVQLATSSLAKHGGAIFSAVSG